VANNFAPLACFVCSSITVNCIIACELYACIKVCHADGASFWQPHIIEECLIEEHPIQSRHVFWPCGRRWRINVEKQEGGTQEQDGQADALYKRVHANNPMHSFVMIHRVVQYKVNGSVTFQGQFQQFPLFHQIVRPNKRMDVLMIADTILFGSTSRQE